jgi:hypothetical protein
MICVRNTACTPLTSTAPPNERQRNAAAGIATEPQEGKHEGTGVTVSVTVHTFECASIVDIFR